MKTPRPIIIEELREAGDDGGDLMGFYCRGHVERYLFAEAANKHSGAESSYDIRHVRAQDCRHVWFRTVQMEGQARGTMEYRPVVQGDRGAWAATVCECLVDHEYRRMRRILNDHNSGRLNGIAEGVNWCLRFIEHRDRKLHDEMTKAFREQRSQVEADGV